MWFIHSPTISKTLPLNWDAFENNIIYFCNEAVSQISFVVIVSKTCTPNLTYINGIKITNVSRGFTYHFTIINFTLQKWKTSRQFFFVNTRFTADINLTLLLLETIVVYRSDLKGKLLFTWIRTNWRIHM